jgi:nucleotide-binding universal stress UspA family protein
MTTTIGDDLPIHFDSVIFATDFSPASQNAGLYSSALAIHFLSSLVVAHGFTLLQAALEVEVGERFASQQRIDLHQYLKQTADTLIAGRGATETVLLDGDPCTVIPLLALRRSPALTVLGSHGGGSIDRFFLGSTAEGILRHSCEPTLTVGPYVSTLRSGAVRFRRILYATDCSVEATRTASFAAGFAGAVGAELDVLNVLHSIQVRHPGQLHSIQQTFFNVVNSTLPQRVGEMSDPRTFVSAGQPADEILKHVSEREIDLLILGLKGNGHLGIQNRTADVFPIIVKARCPVITVAAATARQS